MCKCIDTEIKSQPLESLAAKKFQIAKVQRGRVEAQSGHGPEVISCLNSKDRLSISNKFRRQMYRIQATEVLIPNGELLSSNSS